MQKETLEKISLLATGIGSVPFLETGETVARILRELPEMPFWPQMVKISPEEDMLTQYQNGLPLEPGKDREGNLAAFYERYISGETEHFALKPSRARGWYAFIEALERTGPPGPFLKGQVVGPITLAYSLKGWDGKALLYDGEVLQALAIGLGMQAVWQARKLASLGAIPVIFVDEPALSGYGSAFMPIGEEKVLETLGDLTGIIREKTGALTGLHCCGNSDWPLLLRSPIDMISLDAYGYGDQFVSSHESVKKFLDQGKVIAWGIVPTGEFRVEDPLSLYMGHLERLWDQLEEKGIARKTLAGQAVFTPACGLGSLSQDQAEGILKTLHEISREARQKYL